MGKNSLKKVLLRKIPVQLATEATISQARRHEKASYYNHVLRLPDFCIPTSLYPFILRIGKVCIHHSFRSGITKNRFFLAIVIIRKQRV